MEVRTTKRYLYLQGCIEMQKKPVLFWYYYSSKDYLKVKDLVIFAVAPHAGAWIEILMILPFSSSSTSLPTRERGLKLHKIHIIGEVTEVAPHAGAWIEI